MKNYAFLIILFSVLGSALQAQVKIGGAVEIPHPSAVLELDGGNNRGLLLPRMRSEDIQAIASPAEGLTIYSTDQQAVYLRRSGNWIKMNSDNDGISLPYFKQFDYDGTLFRITNQFTNGICIQGSDLSSGLGYGVIGTSNNGIGIHGIAEDINTGIAGHFVNNGGGRSLISMNKTGIGTGNPEGLLHINGSNMAGNTITIDDDADPTIQFRKLGSNRSYIRQQGNDLVFRPNGQNSSGKVVLQSYNDGGWMFLDASGNTSLGQDPATYSGTPNNVRMHIKSTNENVLTLESLNGAGIGPTLNFIEKTGNTTNSTSSISSNNTGMTFKSTTAKSYDWFGNGSLFSINSNSAMTLKKSSVGPFVLYNLGVSGYIGAGTASPEAQIHISAGSVLGAAAYSMIIDNYFSPLVSFRVNSVEKGFIQQLDNDLKIGTVAANDPGRFIVRTNGFDRLWVDSVGYVTIGGRIGPTLNGPYRLAVRGKIAATDFNVVASGSWPDYVFDPSYKLRSLEETEAFIKEHRHLPNIPAAAVVDKEGFALGDMQKRMMEKIEELTLHLIEANKAIKELSISGVEAKNEIILLKNQIRALDNKK